MTTKITYAVLMITFPFIMHPISRYYMLRKARNIRFVQKKNIRAGVAT